LENRKDAFSIELQQYCITQPVCVIRGLAGALKLGMLHVSVLRAFYISFVYFCHMTLENVEMFLLTLWKNGCNLDCVFTLILWSHL